MVDQTVESLLRNSEQITFAVIAVLLIIIILMLLAALIRYISANAAQSDGEAKDRHEERTQNATVLRKSMETLDRYIAQGDQMQEAFRQTTEINALTAATMSSLSESFTSLSAQLSVSQTRIEDGILQLSREVRESKHKEAYILLSTDNVVRAVSEKAALILGVPSLSILSSPFSWKDYKAIQYDGVPIGESHYIIDTVRDTGVSVHNHLISIYNSAESRYLWVRVNCEQYRLNGKDNVAVGVLITLREIDRIIY